MDMARFRLRLRESGTFALCRSTSAHVGLTTATSTADAHGYLRRVIFTGEIPSAWVDASERALARLRDNDDRDAAVTWDPLSGPFLRELRCAGEHSALTFPRGSANSGFLYADNSGICLQAVHAMPSLAVSLAAGCSGGLFERALRRVGRDALISFRYAVNSTLLWAAEGAADRVLRSHLDAACVAAAAMGLAPPPVAAVAAVADSTLTGAREAPSSSSASSPASAAVADGSNGSGAAAASTTSALWDLASGALVGTDTGLSGVGERVSKQCMAIVLASLKAMVAAAGEDALLPSKGAAAALALTEARAALETLTTTVDAVVSSILLALTYQSSPGAGGRVIRAGAIAEASLLAQHSLPFVAIACGVLASTVSAAVSKASSAATASTAKEKQGKAKAGAAASRPAAAATSSSEDSASLSTWVMVTRSSIAALAKSLVGLEKELSNLVDAFDEAEVKSGSLVFGAFPPSECVTAFVTTHLTARSGNTQLNGGGGSSSLADMRAHVLSAEAAQSTVFRRLIGEAARGAMASMGMTVSKVRSEVQARVTFLKSLRLADV